MDKNTLQQLAMLYMRGEASDEEKQQLHKWYDENVDEEEEYIYTDTDETQDHIKARILVAIQQRTGMSQNPDTAKVISFFDRSWLRIAAIFLVLTIGTATYLFFNNSSKPGIVKTGTVTPHDNDILPGQNKATLTLANGDIIALDSAGFGKLAQQGSTEVLNQNGQLVYTSAGQPGFQLMYNTLKTARGEVYPLVLSDGTKVWLNAESSIHFPVSFTGVNRSVDITGEAYFEVATNKQKPFIVNVRGASIQVLGTQFNVMAYENEDVINTTLLEGSVSFIRNGNNILLSPGEQSQVDVNGQIKLIKKIDVQKEVAWKNGFFDFEGSNFETIAKQLSRWYDVEVKYDKKVNEQFYAKISRNTKLSVVLKALELTGKVHFEINGKNIIVKP